MKLAFLLFCAITLNCLGPSMALADRLLDFIGQLEAPQGYGQVYGGAPDKPSNLTEMTVGEVLAWQRSIQGRTVSTAAGRFQIIEPTLSDLVRRFNVPLSAQFSPAMQDRLAHYLISDCGPRPTGGDMRSWGTCLAGIWAALPVLQGPQYGRSRYQGIAGNQARVSADEYLAFLQGRQIAVPQFETTYMTSVMNLAEINGIIEETSATGGMGASIRIRLGRDPYATN